MSCHCGSPQPFDACCLPLINGAFQADTPEQLMRSRYSAFCIEDAQYLHRTWLPGVQHQHPVEAIQSSFTDTHWCRLEVLASDVDGDSGNVEFNAYYLNKGDVYLLHEQSQFKRHQNQWYYCQGNIATDSGRLNIGRNAPCPCGSGKKFKRCCIAKL